ncbi:hypothetical protein FLM9_1381 [Candidatus Synechococcus spongiarum]|uniref:Uncharacterized protein n=2 Tax=Candidatus Synechococcus spongiarum TaxID=431041 RepID=A0A164YYP7_9SYNE|nr:hypothetical protein FLM9_1381 [Candidatus Synechococcus spongiarum]
METSAHPHPSQSRNQVSLFRPYCAAAPGSSHFGDAMAIFSRGELAGVRQIQDGESIGFSLRWQPGQLPADPCPCTLTIRPVPGACYQFSVPSYQAVLWLLEVCRSQAGRPSGEQAADLPQAFWTQVLSA